MDYDIDMKKDYKYSFKIDDQPKDVMVMEYPPYSKFIYITSLSEQVSNC